MKSLSQLSLSASEMNKIMAGEQKGTGASGGSGGLNPIQVGKLRSTAEFGLTNVEQQRL